MTIYKHHVIIYRVHDSEDFLTLTTYRYRYFYGRKYMYIC